MTAVMSEVRAWRGEAPSIPTDRILRLQGYPDVTRVRPRVRAIADAMAAEAARLTDPEARHLRVAIAARGAGRLELADGTVFRCSGFDRLMREAIHVAAFVLTLGSDLDRGVADRMAGSEPVEALFLEAAGWLAIEQATRAFSRDLRAEATDDGLGVTFRMAPGYAYRAAHGDAREMWPLEEQGLLFGLFGDAELPVSLMDSGAMLPKMSRSGIFGLAPPPSRDAPSP